MNTNTLSVGKEVLSVCNKCKLILAHIVLSLKDHKTADKVQCKTCKGTHTYKDPSQQSKTKSKLSVKKIVSHHGKNSKSHNNIPIGDMWLKAINNSTAPQKDYATNAKFILGDIINHPSFGQGVVEKLIDQNKIEVLFKDNYRTLLHNK